MVLGDFYCTCLTTDSTDSFDRLRINHTDFFSHEIVRPGSRREAQKAQREPRITQIDTKEILASLVYSANSAFKASFVANLHLRPPSVCYYEEANLEGRQGPTALPLYVSWLEQIKNHEDTKK